MQIYISYLKEYFFTAIEVAQNTTIDEALQQSNIFNLFPQIKLYQYKYGIYSKIKSSDTILQEYDRIEIYTPLIADPKEQRQKRAEKKRLSNQEETQKWHLKKSKFTQ